MVASPQLNDQELEGSDTVEPRRVRLRLPQLPKIEMWKLMAASAIVIGVGGAIAMGLRTAAPDETVMQSAPVVTQEQFNLLTPSDYAGGVRLPASLEDAESYKAGIYAYAKQSAKFDEDLRRKLMIERAALVRQAAVVEVNSGRIDGMVPNAVFDMQQCMATVNEAVNCVVLRKASEAVDYVIKGEKMLNDPTANLDTRNEGGRLIAAGLENYRTSVLALGVPAREAVGTTGNVSAGVKEIQSWLVLLQSKAKVGMDATITTPTVPTIQQPVTTAPITGGK